MTNFADFEIEIQEPQECPSCGRKTLLNSSLECQVPNCLRQPSKEICVWGCCISPALACDSADLTCTTCNWTGFERYGRLFEENDLAGVMNAHAQHGSDLFLQGTGLQVFVDNEAESETPPWLDRNALNHGRCIANSLSMRQRFDQAVDTAEIFISEFSHPLDGHAELRPQAERCLELMRQRLAGLALAVIGAHAEAGDATAVEMADRAAAGVLDRYRDDAAAAIEMTYARTLLVCGRSSQARFAVLS